MKQIILFAFLITMFPHVYAGSVYRCVVDGAVTFSQQPCAPDAEELTVKYIQRDDAAAARALEEHEKSSAYLERMRLERMVRTEQDKITSLQRQRDAELSTLRQRQQNANNNLAGATYRQSLAEEMQAVNQRYDSRVAQHQATIERAQAELDQMNQ